MIWEELGHGGGLCGAAEGGAALLSFPMMLAHRMVRDHLLHKVHPLREWDLHPTPGPLCKWKQLAESGPAQLPSPPPFPLISPTLPLSRGITPICSMVFRGACSGISWGGRGRFALAAHPDPSLGPPTVPNSLPGSPA